MNPCIPDWNYFDSDPLFSNQRKPNPDLMELLYRNGQVVAQSQTHRKPSANRCRQEHTQQPLPKQQQLFHQTAVSFGETDLLAPDTVTASWIEYPTVDDSLDKELSSHFFTEPPDPMETDHNPIKQQLEEVPTKTKPHFVPEPPPRVQLPGSFQPNHKGVNFGQFSTHPRHGSAPRFVGKSDRRDVDERSGMTVGSSNHVCNVPKIVPQEMRKTEVELNVSSSSDGSGSSFGGTHKNSAAVNGLKRKGGDVEDSECQSEDESAGGKKSVRPPGSTRRSRAAEVHNLSERKRRDRINKKMRALQELIPHCNKTDKASMLDEAIEYLKSLQLQLQMMWMGGAMAPMMFQGMQPYMAPMAMGMGMGAHPMSNSHNNMTVPKADQSVPIAASTPNPNVMSGHLSQTPILNPNINFHQMQNQSIPDQYARFMAMHQMQAATNSQSMNMFRFGPGQSAQPPQPNAPPVNIMGQYGARKSTNDALSNKI